MMFWMKKQSTPFIVFTRSNSQNNLIGSGFLIIQKTAFLFLTKRFRYKKTAKTLKRAGQTH
jgi:hypothetical protein